MSKKQNTTTEVQDSGPIVTGNDDGTELGGERVFKLNKTKEIANRFRGDHEIRYVLPVAVPGQTVADLLANGPAANVVQTLLNIAERFDPSADFATVLVGKVNGQGLNLDIQKQIKDYLADTNEATKELSVEGALTEARRLATEAKIGAPRTKGTGTTSKVAKAEARASAAVNTALDMYRNLTPELRATYRPMLLSGNMATEEELDAIEAEVG